MDPKFIKEFPQMAKKTPARSKRPSAKMSNGKTVGSTTVSQGREKISQNLGLPMAPWTGGLRAAKGAEARSGKRGFVLAFGRRDGKIIKRVAGEHLNRWQLQMLAESESESLFFQGVNGPVWVLRAPEGDSSSAAGLEKSHYTRFRDLIGPVVSASAPYGVEKLVLQPYDLGPEEMRGIIVGLEMASYSYAEHRGTGKKKRRKLPSLLLKTEKADQEVLSKKETSHAASLGLCVNLARHLTNLPGGDLNPRVYAEIVRELFSASASVSTEVWEGERLQRENMNLLLAVGGAAAEGPRLVHLRYRPKKTGEGIKPVAIVGKGITFDSGGLDIKPSSGMRWMKKDMGGSAAAVAIMKWAELTELAHPLDVYVSLAENAIAGNAFRPGDIITARNGSTVEIHNTDAEGRLVLADALDLAVTQQGENAPSAVINIATLTGANKVALGAEIAGLYSNDDDLSRVIAEAGHAKGDLVWRMPLFQPYRSGLKSTFADMSNCSDGFGGAITAALFLESFVRDVPFAHLDIYAWKDGASGPYSETGGNGQSVQGVAETLLRLASGHQADGRG
jgi:leucyl aminopeptidase